MCACICQHINPIADLHRFKQFMGAYGKVVADVFIGGYCQPCYDGLVLCIQDLKHLLEHLHPTGHRLFGVFVAEPDNRPAAQILVIIQSIGVHLLFLRLESGNRRRPDLNGPPAQILTAVL